MKTRKLNHPPFAKGNPGGPGRPPKSQCYNDVTREMLEAQKIDIKLATKDGKEKHIFLESDKSLMHSVIAGQIKEAITGNTQAAAHLADRAYGKLTDKLDTNADVKVTINYVEARKRTADISVPTASA